MDVNLSSLKTFLAVARHRGITRALGELHLTQPAVFRQIQGLEEYLDTHFSSEKDDFSPSRKRDISWNIIPAGYLNF